MHGTGSAPNDVRGQTALVMLTLGIISATTSLTVFGRDKIVFWREQASGVAVLPYFLANTAVNLVDVALHPLVFLSIYQSMTLPAIPFATHYLIGVLVVWWTSSAGCLISILVGQPANALVAAVAVVMIAGGFINGVSPNYRELGAATKRITSLSYNRWAVEAVVVASYENYPTYMWPLTKALVNLAGYCGLDASGVPAISGNSIKGRLEIVFWGRGMKHEERERGETRQLVASATAAALRLAAVPLRTLPQQLKPLKNSAIPLQMIPFPWPPAWPWSSRTSLSTAPATWATRCWCSSWRGSSSACSP